MNLRKVVNNLLTENQNSKFWYHGTPNAKKIEDAGGFGSHEHSIEIIKNPKEFKRLSDEIQDTRLTNPKRYFELIKGGEIDNTKSYVNIKKPIFLSDDYSVAKSYADPHREFNYQDSDPKTLRVSVDTNNSKILKVHAFGVRFRGLPTENVRTAFENAGVPSEKIDTIFEMFQLQMLYDKTSTDALAAMAQLLDFDIIDVIGVLDSYHGGTVKSTVRIVFNPSLIKIIN
jgi:hypothetical protein